RQVGIAVRSGNAAAARLRRSGAGALERAYRALFATGGTRQYAGSSALDRSTVLSSAVQASAAPLAETAGGVHAQEYVAPSRCIFAATGFFSPAIFAGGARRGS